MGRIGAPQGLKGEVRVQSFAEDPFALKSYSPLLTADGKELMVQSMRPAKNMFVVRFKEITTREAAEALKGQELSVDRALLDEQDLEADEFFIADLEGLDVRDTEGETIGRVAAVENFGASDILDIQPKSGKRFMLAFTELNVPELNIEEGWLSIDPPEELDAKGDGA